MKKFLLSFGLIIAFVFYVMLSSTRNLTQQVTTTQSTTTTTITPPIASTLTPTTITDTNKFKDGTYTGPAVDAYYGTVQVKITIQNGNLGDVQFLQYPNDRGNSVRINTRAMPMLKTEAIQMQTSAVDGVSGATATTEAFKQSLAAALVLAAN